MKKSTRYFIACIVNKVLAVLFAFLGAFLHDLHRPPFEEMGSIAYWTAVGLALTSVVTGIVGLNWHHAEDLERRWGNTYDKNRR